MRITFFFRKPSIVYHSIENLFDSIISKITDNQTIKHYSPFQSKGLINRILIGLDVRKHQSEINHITGDIHFAALFLKKNRTVLTIHDIGILKEGNFLKRFIIKLFWFNLPLLRVRYVTVISEFTKQELMKSCNFSSEKVYVINNCISDIYQFVPKQINTERPVILQIGTKPNKNLERLINAIKQIDCKLLIVGKLNTKQILALQEKQIDYENHVNLSEQQIHKLYVSSDMLTFVSIYEGFGIPIIEANAVGRPVITSDIEPMKSVASDAAILVNPFNENEITLGIKRLIADKTLRDKLIKKGMENAKKYRSDFIAKKYIEIYRKIIK